MTNKRTLAQPNRANREIADLLPRAELSDANARHRRIEEAAYLRAATRGFADGDPVEDWLLAEAEVSAAEAAAKR